MKESKLADLFLSYAVSIIEPVKSLRGRDKDRNMKAKTIAATCIVMLTLALSLFTGCGKNDKTDNGSSPAETAAPTGETKTYSYHNFEFELTNVASERSETITDDGGGEWTYTVITYNPGAVMTVINADMTDPAYAEDGKAHPQWAILSGEGDMEERIKITDYTERVCITPHNKGVYNLETSLYIYKFEESK